MKFDDKTALIIGYISVFDAIDNRLIVNKLIVSKQIAKKADSKQANIIM